MTKVAGSAHETREIEIEGHPVAYRLYRSDRGTLEISVAAGGLMEVRAPRGPSIERIEERLRARSAWIRRKLADRALRAPCVLPRTFVAGESHRYLGRQYRLTVTSGDRSSVRVHGGRLHVEVPDPRDRAQVRRALTRWFGGRARALIPKRLATLTTAAAFRGLRPAAIAVRSMRNRWGSCSPEGRLLLNAQLIALPVSLIDYVIAHELCHLRVPTHGVRFERLLARVMPDWRSRHGRLCAAET